MSTLIVMAETGFLPQETPVFPYLAV